MKFDKEENDKQIVYTRSGKIYIDVSFQSEVDHSKYGFFDLLRSLFKKA